MPEHIRQLTLDEFASVASPYIHTGSLEDLGAFLAEVPTRIKTLCEIDALVAPLFSRLAYDEASWSKHLATNMVTKVLLQDFLAGLDEESLEDAAITTLFKEIASKNSLNLTKTTTPIRVALLYNARGLPLNGAILHLGVVEVRARIEQALALL